MPLSRQSWNIYSTVLPSSTTRTFPRYFTWKLLIPKRPLNTSFKGKIEKQFDYFQRRLPFLCKKIRKEHGLPPESRLKFNKSHKNTIIPAYNTGKVAHTERDKQREKSKGQAYFFDYEALWLVFSELSLWRRY